MATAWPRESIGTMFGRNDCEAGSRNARATPKSASTAKTGTALEMPCSANANSNAEQIAKASMQSPMMTLRS